MSILGGLTIRKLLKDQILVIQSKDPRHPFDMSAQVTEDAIDLQISNQGKIIASKVQKIDTNKFDPEVSFEDVTIPESGFRLRPGQVLYTNTLEVVSLPDNLAGRVSSRSTFARMGLSVHFTHPKLAVGHRQAIPLQLVNHNSVDLIIHAYSPLVQLQLEEVTGPAEPYAGKYREEIDYAGPIITNRDQQVASVSDRTRKLIDREIEEFRREIVGRAEKEVKRKGADALIKESDIKMVIIPKKRVDLLQFFLIGLGGLLVAWGFSFLTDSGDLDRWKITALVTTVLSGIICWVVAGFLQYYEAS